jgi:hypothetical protein
MKAQFTEDNDELQSSLCDPIHCSWTACWTLSTLLDNREQAHVHLALHVHTQSQHLVDIQPKAQADGDQMSGLYAMSCREAKKLREDTQAKADNAEWERRAAEWKMKKDCERKFKDFTRALQTKFSEETLKRSVCSPARSVLTWI